MPIVVTRFNAIRLIKVNFIVGSFNAYGKAGFNLQRNFVRNGYLKICTEDACAKGTAFPCCDLFADVPSGTDTSTDFKS